MKELETIYTAPDCRVVTFAAKRIICTSGDVPDYDVVPYTPNWI